MPDNFLEYSEKWKTCVSDERIVMGKTYHMKIILAKKEITSKPLKDMAHEEILWANKSVIVLIPIYNDGLILFAFYSRIVFFHV